MSYTVIVNNNVYTLPDPGDPPLYAEELKAFFQELASVSNNQQGPLDISETDFNFINNKSTPTDVQGFSIITAAVASFVASYVIKRTDGTLVITESGQLFGKQGASGWTLAIGNVQADSSLFDGYSGVEFSITSVGQVQYTSTNLPGQTQGIITFKVKTIAQG
jgi:hypothetical protein